MTTEEIEHLSVMFGIPKELRSNAIEFAIEIQRMVTNELHDKVIKTISGKTQIIKTVVHSFIDGTPCEVSYVDANNETVGFWVCGHFDPNYEYKDVYFIGKAEVSETFKFIKERK